MSSYLVVDAFSRTLIGPENRDLHQPQAINAESAADAVRWVLDHQRSFGNAEFVTFDYETGERKHFKASKTRPEWILEVV